MNDEARDVAYRVWRDAQGVMATSSLSRAFDAGWKARESAVGGAVSPPPPADVRLSELTDEHYEIARKAVEDVLIEFRDDRISVLRNNGLVVKERDGSESSVIRLGFDDALRIAVKALLEPRVSDHTEERAGDVFVVALIVVACVALLVFVCCYGTIYTSVTTKTTSGDHTEEPRQ